MKDVLQLPLSLRNRKLSHGKKNCAGKAKIIIQPQSINN